MIQILYTNDSSYNERIIVDAKEYAKQQEFVCTPQKKSRRVTSARRMMITSLILIIAACTVFLVGFGSWNVASEAMSQEEILINQIPELSNDVKQCIKQTVFSLEDNTLKEAKIAEKKLVVKKAIAPNGKKYDTIAYLSIPSLGIEYPVLATTTTELLKVSLNKYWGPNPNQVGNLCIVGHNYRNSRFFSKVPNLVEGDSIDITDLSGKTITYKVYSKYEVDPSDVSCTTQLTNGRREITLITCTDDSKYRVVVKARQVK